VLKGTTDETNFGTLRIDFQDHPDLEPITFEEFFDRFESGNLAFRYNDEELPEGGSPEDYFKLVNRDNAAVGPDDQVLPDSGDPAVTEDNVFPSSPAEEHERPRGESEEGEDQQTVW